METVYILTIDHRLCSGIINRNSTAQNVLQTKRLSHAKTFVTKNKAMAFAQKVKDNWYEPISISIHEVSMEVKENGFSSCNSL